MVFNSELRERLNPFDTLDVLQRSFTYTPMQYHFKDNIPEKCLNPTAKPFIPKNHHSPSKWPHNLADRKSVPNNNEQRTTGVNFNSNIMLLNATPNAHDLSTLTISEVDPREKVQIFLYFTIYCYVFSMYLYICIHTPPSRIRSINNSHCITFTRMSNINDKNMDPYKLLKSIKVSNINHLIIGQVNIDSLRNKIEAFKLIMNINVDILVVTESKLDETFPKKQFCFNGYAPPFRLDRTINGGGVIIYVREDIPSKELTEHPYPINFKGIIFEINLKKKNGSYLVVSILTRIIFSIL